MLKPFSRPATTSLSPPKITAILLEIRTKRMCLCTFRSPTSSVVIKQVSPHTKREALSLENCTLRCSINERVSNSAMDNKVSISTALLFRTPCVCIDLIDAAVTETLEIILHHCDTVCDHETFGGSFSMYLLYGIQNFLSIFCVVFALGWLFVNGLS